MKSQKALRNITLAMFASPQIAMFALNTSAIVYLPSLYAEDMGLGLATVGAIFTLARIYDFITDPAFGYISDHVSSRFGRRRIWLVIALPIAMLSYLFLYWPDEGVSATTLLVGLILYLSALTMVQTSHFSWGSELSYNYHEKTRIMSWMQGGIVLGSVVVLVTPIILEFVTSESSGSSRINAVNWMGWLLAVITPITFILCLSGTKERPAIVHGAQSGFGKTLLYMLKDDALRRLFIVDILMGFGAGLVQVLSLFYIGYVLSNAAASTQAVFALVLASFVGLPVWTIISHHIGKHQTVMLANGLFVLIAIAQMLFMRSSDSLLIVLSWAFLGMNKAVVFSLARSIMSDVVDAHSVNAGGIERTGLFFSCLTLSTKIGFGLSVGLGFFLLDLIGFVPGPGNSEEVLENFRYIFYLVPAIFFGATVFIMRGFPLDENSHKLIQAKLEAKDL